jgi:phage-related protein
MSWKTTFFNRKVEEETFAFPDGVLANLPLTAPMSGGLFEVRAKGKESIGRSLFCTLKGKEIVILHSFIKKAQTTPKKELEKARKRKKELI